MTPRGPNFHRSASGSTGASIELEEHHSNGLGSLADELGDGWGDEAVEEHGSVFLNNIREDTEERTSRSPKQDDPHGLGDMHDFGLGMPLHSPRPSSQSASKSTLQLPMTQHHKSPSQVSYDGSDYFSPTSPDSSSSHSLPPSFLRHVSDIESLTRLSVFSDDLLSEHGALIPRTTHALKDLGAQSSIENGVTRLITAYTSMSMHRSHKTKDLFAMSHGLLYSNQVYGSGLPPPVAHLDEPTLDTLLQSVDDLELSIPVPGVSAQPQSQQNPLLSLQILASQTNELIYSLRALSDVLHESRVAANTASRRLKSVKELASEMKQELDLAEEGVRWIEEGGWEERLSAREAGRACREVVSGFEGVCQGWKDKLMGVQDPAVGVGFCEVAA